MSIDLSWWKEVPPLLEDPVDLLRSYIINPQIPIHDPELFIKPRVANIERLYFAPPCAQSTTIVPERDLQTGEILDFIEADIEDCESNSRNSMSLKRAPGPPELSTKGSAINYPFWPGGFDEPEKHIASLNLDNTSFETDLLTIAPGFTRGIQFTDCNTDKNIIATNDNDEVSTMPQMIDLLSIVEQEHNILGLWKTDTSINQSENTKSADDKNILADDSNVPNDYVTIDVQKPIEILKISETSTLVKNLQYAEMVDVTQPIKYFEIKIPKPAHKYPFELDIFQKQAILKLEEHNHVFVAAHTSAGKTVVAEYAIALSQQHMTRAIYTSPIKALSNQKYRDFKDTFKDVGLITGDIQIDPTASCLIMTTEILRSMLYCGSEVTRDLEYVIFDEVHYITDPDRGHVWEEVLILLPDHVSIVMLSATVPNTIEFANWVGLTKKRKVYVISTPKRPVPLMHHLYTGSGGKSRDNFYLLVNDLNEFQMKGYRDALASIEKDKSKDQKISGSNSGSSGGFNAKDSRKKQFQQHINKQQQHDPKNIAKQEQNMWVGIIDFLKRNDKLPSVAFTLSRNRCDRNLQALQSVDLCTAKEANHVHAFFQRCLQKLKPEDRNIPQVKILQDSLKRGIGVHHSGILPILKEIVEILFQTGFVKLLFATETFAMGVNMPARTVIFDNHRKFDGVESRALRPAEYTQMAGRAGRRGLDKTGTVILLCKGNVPTEVDLRTMIMGRPMRLESKFRLTYAMILNLLRVESVTVEDMMSHSFMEFGSQTKVPENKVKLKEAEEQISTMQELSEHMQPLCKFYEIAYEYIQQWNSFMGDFVGQQRIAKELKPGRVLIVSHSNHYNKLAILLSVSANSSKESTYKVLALDDQIIRSTSAEIKLTASHDSPSKDTKPLDRGELWHRMISLTPQYQQYQPEGVGGHTILLIKSPNIVEITTTTFTIEADKLLQNWEQRQIPRFRDSPPGPTFVKTLTELYNLNNSVISGETKLKFLNLKKEFNINMSMDLLTKTRKNLNSILSCTNVPNFEQEFAIVYDRKTLETRREELKFKISKKSLSLYPDYINKLEVLKALSYIDGQHEVTMKGRVACEMGSNELIITELVLCNTFTDLEPEEIAALLSSLVFQAKTDNQPKLTDNLKKCIEAIQKVDQDIVAVENSFNVQSNDETIVKDRLNFGLVEVVYEWSRNKSFAEIMTLTDIQEGIIVRCIQQLNETIQDVQQAARIIGNPVLHKKMEEASNAIKRDIVFAASLYIQQ